MNDYCVEVTSPKKRIILPDGRWDDVDVFLNGCLLKKGCDYMFHFGEDTHWITFEHPIGVPVAIERTFLQKIFKKQEFKPVSDIVMIVHRSAAQGCSTCGK